MGHDPGQLTLRFRVDNGSGIDTDYASRRSEGVYRPVINYKEGK
jgi:hypothetical protein